MTRNILVKKYHTFNVGLKANQSTRAEYICVAFPAMKPKISQPHESAADRSSQAIGVPASAATAVLIVLLVLMPRPHLHSQAVKLWSKDGNPPDPDLVYHRPQMKGPLNEYRL
ncbi:hypothetical protein [Rhizobium nepotum]|uniref:hypothetical protein n=1 Tax=Rhizobium nepotum TaxID=1035271 RepID=UPI00336A4864